MIYEDYCSFEVAKLLKEKGFNSECRAAYTNYGKLFTTQIQQYITNAICSKGYLWDCTAPTHQMAMKWLREIHNLSVETFSIKGTSNVCPVFWKGNVVKLLTQDRVFNGELVGSYEEAIEAALKYSLESLV